MALSGTFYKNVASGYRLQIEWSATQNVANNTSTVTQKLYWISLGSAYYINSSAVKNGYQNINGGTDSTFSGAGLADINGNQKKLLDTHTETVSHNSDGTKSVLLEAMFNPDVTLSGTRYTNVTLSSTVTLNTIPRSSTLTSSASFTAGDALSVSISRASSSFTHTVRLYVAGSDGNFDLMKEVKGVTTGVNMGFTDTELENIFKQLAGASSRGTRIDLLTYSGTSQVGSTKSYSGTVTSRAASKITSTSSANFNIGDSVYVAIDRDLSKFTHTIKFYVANVLIKTVTDVGFGYTWEPTTNEISNMYNLAKSANSVSTKIELTTYMGSTQVRSATSITGTAKVAGSAPSFGTGFTYKDTNTTTLGITGNAQQIIQGKSNVRVEIPAGAEAVGSNGATIVQYVATLNGVERIVNAPFASPIVFDFGVVNASTNVTLSIKAIDSRGNSKTSTKTVTMVPYASPDVNAKVVRSNSFENTTTLSLNGSISSLSGKNAVLGTDYRFKQNISSATFSAWTPIERTSSGTSYTGTSISFDLDNTKSYVFEIRVTDKLGTKSVTKSVAVGKPIFFIEAVQKALGLNMFPTAPNMFELEGSLKTYSSLGTMELSGRDFRINSRRAMVGFGSDVDDTLHVNYRTEFPSGVKLWGKLILTDYIENMGYVFPSLQNGWTNYSGTSGFQRASYYKDKNSNVFISGLIRNGTATDGTTLLTLPAGYRPLNQHTFICATQVAFDSGKPARIDVYPDGTVKGTSALDPSWTSLAGIVFKAEQ
ncbi:DUF859 family phage minor structural protein [Priestia megaterium]|uniref:DUF859 family phage minor structural protein n=1 Tax=Priestia megaterium TaxID=1404 RepID=UPI002E1ADDAA|nr:DUF859 family phage minor structural protein [Priestia megaterium]